MVFDKKAIIMLMHYKSIIEERNFDEYDILGFLIFIREYIENLNYSYIKEFTHLVAHRNRDRGKVMDCIRNAIINDYQHEHKSKAVKGYNGMLYDDWKKEWIALGLQFNIMLTELIIFEITLCVFSLSQFTEYKTKFKTESFSGRIEIFQGPDNSLCLTTTEGQKNSPYIIFFKISPITFKNKFIAGPMIEPLETIRINGILHLRDSAGLII